VAVNRLGISQHASAPRRRVRRVGDAVRVGYLGRFDPIKGVHDLGEAIRRLRRDAPIELEFRGPASTPQDRNTRAALERTFAGDARVRFEGPVPPWQVLEVIAGYDVLCCPSRCLEGGPTVGLEALAAGTPVIAADTGGLAEVIEDGVNGRLVAPGNVAAIAAALDEVAREPGRTIDRWRQRLPRPRTMRDVAADYLALYGARD
jgi:glycosyltransferase involved in cell wall biosynthesis